MTSIAFAQGRLASSRVPNKSAMELAGLPVFHHCLSRVKEGWPDADHYVVLTTRDSVDDPMAMLARELGWEVRRHIGGSSVEMLALFQDYGMDDDDLYSYVPCDSPLCMCKHIGFSVEALRQHDAACAIPVMPLGSLVEATFATGVGTVGAYKESVRTVHVVDIKGCTFDSSVYERRSVLVRFPEEYNQPWRWGRVTIDFPVQALALKEIYRLLYKGVPIDILGLPALFDEHPLLAGVIPFDTPESTNPQYPTGYFNAIVEEVRRTNNYVEVEWKEDRQISRCVK